MAELSLALAGFITLLTTVLPWVIGLLFVALLIGIAWFLVIAGLVAKAGLRLNRNRRADSLFGARV